MSILAVIGLIMLIVGGIIIFFADNGDVDGDIVGFGVVLCFLGPILMGIGGCEWGY